MNKNLHRIYIGLFFTIGIISVLLLILQGFDYYATSLLERPFSESHKALKPSGTIGHGLGILGTLMMIFGVSIYMIRKRVRKFHSLGFLKHWLELHIFLCTLGPVFVLFHTAFKFGGIVAVSFWSMVMVVLSGFIGRYIYIQIPRSIRGNELSLEEIDSYKKELTGALREKYKLSEVNIAKINAAFGNTSESRERLWVSFSHSLADYFRLPGIVRSMKNIVVSEGVLDKTELASFTKILKERLQLERRIGMLKNMQRLFHYWHVFHLPFAITMFVIMVIHVGVTLAFGYKWIF